MKKLPQISEAEYEVMKVIWKYAPINTNEVTDKLTSVTKWKPKTIHTLLKRLIEKEVITYHKESRVFVYTPLINEDDYIQHQSHSFLKRFYNGNMASMLISYLNHDYLTDDDINDLKHILDVHSSKE